MPSLRRDARRLDLSAPYASGLGRRARRGACGGPADQAWLVRATRGTRRLGTRALGRCEGVLGKAQGVGADAEASGPSARVDRRAAARRQRARVLGRIKFGVPLFERVELQKFE
jgi:hypothetical protein